MRFILKNPVKLDVSAIQQSCGTEYRMTTVHVCIWTKRCVSSHFHQQLSSYVLLPSPWLLTLCCMHVPLCGVRKSGAEADTQTVRCDVLLVTSNPWANVIPYYCVSLASLWCISMQCRGDEVKKKNQHLQLIFWWSFISTGVPAGVTGTQVFHFEAQLLGRIQDQQCSFGNFQAPPQDIYL